MSRIQKIVVIGLVLVLIGGAAVGPASANHLDGIDRGNNDDQEDSSDDEEEEENEEDDDSPVVDIDLGGVEDAIDDLAGNFDDLSNGFDDFTDNWTDDLADVLTQVLFEPFQELAELLINILTHVFTSYPQLEGNSDVTSLNALSFKIALAAGGLVIAAAGFLHITGPVFGIGYAQVRTLLPRIVAALMFGAISVPLLQMAVDLSEATTYAFKPGNPGFWSSTRLTGEIVLIAVLKSALLLGVILVFLLRDFYIMFAAAIAPLLALGWSFPGAKKYADSMIGTFWAALLIGPVDMVLFRMTLSLLRTEGGSTPHWLLASAGLLMMIWMPYQIFQASQAAGHGFRRMMSGAQRKVSAEKRRQRRENRRQRHEQNQGQTSQQRRNASPRDQTRDEYLYGGK